MKQTIIKAMTLLSFTGLLTAFVLYRAGVLENVFQSSPNGGNMPVTGVISPQNDSAKTMHIMPSSKSIGVTSANFSGNKDTSKINKDSNLPKVTKNKSGLRIEKPKNEIQWDIAASSKSMTPIIKNPERLLVNLDSLINKPKQKNESLQLKESQILRSSKSGSGASIEDIKLMKGFIDSLMKTDSSKIKSKKTPATKTPKK